MTPGRRSLLAASWLGVGLAARAQVAVLPAAADDRAMLGGAGSVVDDGANAFGFPSPLLSASERRAFMVGNALFRTNWVSAPASVEGIDGLGPLYNARSCSSCHRDDGRGHPPQPGSDEDATGFLLRLAVRSRPHPVYGGQLQDQAIDGVRAEGRVAIHVELRRGRYADGVEWELAAPRYEVVDAAYGPLGDGLELSPRVAPQMIGLGLLEQVDEETLLARADPDDRDHDGISGRARFVAGDGGRRIGRFGWKAAQPTVRAQTAAAFANDMGITSSLDPADDCSAAERAAIGERADGGSPELSEHKLDRIAFYGATLAVPARRDVDAPAVQRGEATFRAAGCVACHVPELITGDDGAIAGMRRQRFRPYTDLLLHDMGDTLSDGIDEEGAGPTEWRTPPLWGIGLFDVVSGHHRYLHDGRARDLAEAILWHGGEGEAAAARFRALAATERADLIRFLQSL